MKLYFFLALFSFGACGFCGDGEPSSSEACDDGNAINGDGCDVDCQISCGNGEIDAGEECDFIGFGCDANCRLLCGNGALDPNEECDDGALNSDSTADACRSDCTLPSCGDQVTDAGEVCDHDVCDFLSCSVGSGDGCREDCQGTEVCGDGLLDVLEQCDDGNLSDGDGCSASCVLEGAACGDGIIDAGELCYLPSSLLTLTAPAKDVAIGDIDGDGLSDLVFAHNEFVSILLQGAAGFSAPAVVLPFDAFPTGVALVDVSDDGALDLIVTTFQNPALTILLNNGDGVFALSQELSGFSFDQIIPGDFDNDGDIDLAFDSVSVARNDGTGHFSEPPGFTVDFFPYFAVVGDLDSDNDLDMITAAQDSILGVNKNNGDASFSTTQTFILEGILGNVGSGAVFPFLHPFALDDLEQDGDLDLVAARTKNSSGGEEQLAFFFNDSGVLLDPVFTPLPSASASIDIQSLGGERALLVVVNDLLPNSNPHAIITVYRISGVSVVPRANLATTAFMLSFGVGDLNQDGAPDFVGINRGESVASIFLSNP